MCGIVGYVGEKIKIKKILSKLQKLEYRGYDSSGVAYNVGEKMFSVKRVGQIYNLLGAVGEESADICICHTRWATHGKVNTQNAHPQISYNGNFAVVHNGIIENFCELKKQIGEEKFSSQTDTEVIANILEEKSGSVQEKFVQMLNSIVGSYAICVMQKNSNKLFVAKNKSPLYVAKLESGYFVASDISCFEGKDYYCLKDNMYAIVEKHNVRFYLDGRPCNLELIKNVYNSNEEYLSRFSHYMQKEIAETPQILQNIVKRYSKIVETFAYKNMFSNINNIVLSGCGTAYHACMLGEEWLFDEYHLPTRAYVSSELRYKQNIINKNSLVILLSQSGETADTLAVLEHAKQIGAKVVAVTNVEYSTLASSADFVLPICAGAEIGVASTKAYSAMLAVLYILSSKNAKKGEYFGKILAVSRQISAKIDENIVEMVSKSKRIFFIGRADDGVTAYESALKLKEITYSDACGYYAGELKHGTIALVEPGVVVIAIITNKDLQPKSINAVEEVMSRGANVIVVAEKELTGNFEKINIAHTDDKKLRSILSVVPLQNLAYLVAVKKGLNPDKPRNLAKSVTVE